MSLSHSSAFFHMSDRMKRADQTHVLPKQSSWGYRLSWPEQPRVCFLLVFG